MMSDSLVLVVEMNKILGYNFNLTIPVNKNKYLISDNEKGLAYLERTEKLIPPEIILTPLETPTNNQIVKNLL